MKLTTSDIRVPVVTEFPTLHQTLITLFEEQVAADWLGVLPHIPIALQAEIDLQRDLIDMSDPEYWEKRVRLNEEIGKIQLALDNMVKAMEKVI